MKRRIISLISRVIALCWHPKNAAVILMYHSIGRNPVFFTVSPDQFEKQMRYLSEQNFNVVSLDTLVEYRTKGDIPPKTVAIAFDDGYRDNLTDALPILKRYGFPATVFFTASDVGGVRTLRGTEFPILSEEELRQLDAEDVSIGAHTMTHPKLSKIPAEDVAREVTESKAFVERLLGKPCRHFAYPHGRYTPEVVTAVSEAGFAAAYTTDDGLVRPDTNPYQLNRNGVSSITSLSDFKALVRIGTMSRSRFKRM